MGSYYQTILKLVCSHTLQQNVVVTKCEIDSVVMAKAKIVGRKEEHEIYLKLSSIYFDGDNKEDNINF